MCGWLLAMTTLADAILTLGLATPVTGPRPFDLEAIVQFSFRF